jgi:hypothetical protein
VFGLQRLPFPLDHCLGLLKGLMRMRQHPREGNRCRFWLGVGSEPPPKNHLRLLQSGRWDRARRAPTSPPVVGAGAAGTSSPATDGVPDDIIVVEAVAADRAVGTPSAAALPLAVGGSAAAEPLAGAWEPGDACCWAIDPPAGMTLEAEGEEAL